MLAVGERMLGDLDPCMLKMATPFAGGVGDSSQEMCGALSGGLMVIGALHGRAKPQDSEHKALELAARYRRAFEKEFGTTQCGPLREKVHSPGGSGTCKTLVEQAALVLLEVLGAGGVHDGERKAPSE